MRRRGAGAGSGSAQLVVSAVAPQALARGAHSVSPPLAQRRPLSGSPEITGLSAHLSGDGESAEPSPSKP